MSELNATTDRYKILEDTRHFIKVSISRYKFPDMMLVGLDYNYKTLCIKVCIYVILHVVTGDIIILIRLIVIALNHLSLSGGKRE